MTRTVEQRARNLLERLAVCDAREYSDAELTELATLIRSHEMLLLQCEMILEHEEIHYESRDTLSRTVTLAKRTLIGR